MGTGEWTERAREWIGKYRWAALILVVGLLLMTMPQKQQGPEAAQQPEQSAPETGLEEKLETLLSRLEGAGTVRVLLTQATGAQYHYQMDSDDRQAEGTQDIREETVIITGSDRSQQGLLRRTDPPRYLGAVVLCQGADRPAVKLAVVEAVGTATGLTSDKISVLKMK